MSWLKLAAHDLGCGLRRKRYAFTAALFAMPCLVCRSYICAFGCGCTWADFMLYCFKGVAPITLSDTMQSFYLPILWLLCVGALLFLCLDYPLRDLTTAGQQVLFRSGSRAQWYLSKCLWNLCATVLYFALAALTTALFTLLSGGTLSFQTTPMLAGLLMDSFDPIALSAPDFITAVIIVPFLTLAALNMLQMALCLVIKPIYSFLACMSILILAIYWPNAFALGNGAMAVRSSAITAGGISPTAQILTAIGVILLSVGIGTLRFQRYDILRQEE